MKKLALVIAMTVSIACFGQYRDRVCVIDHHNSKGKLIIRDTLYNFSINKNYTYGFIASDSILYYTLERKELGAINWDYSTYSYDTIKISYDYYTKVFKILR